MSCLSKLMRCYGNLYLYVWRILGQSHQFDELWFNRLQFLVRLRGYNGICLSISVNVSSWVCCVDREFFVFLFLLKQITKTWCINSVNVSYPASDFGLKSGITTRNLVDPASSHMLVSKIKPCMFTIKSFYGESANGSLKQFYSTP